MIALRRRGAFVVVTLVATSGCGVGIIGDRLQGAGGSSAGGSGPGGSGTGGMMMLPGGPRVIVTVLDPRNSGSKVTSPDGLTCGDASNSAQGTACASALLATGAVVTLTAAPAPSFEVTWGGDCASAAGVTCTLTFTGSASVSVSFDPKGPGVWWVSKTGKDTNDGKSIHTAFASLQRGLNQMAAGETLFIDDGVYAGSIGGSAGPYTTWSGGEGKNGLSATNRTRILGYHRHAVTIDGGGKLYPLFIFKGQHIEVGNIVVLHAALDGVSAQDVAHIEQSLDIYLHQVGAAYPDPKCDNCMGIGSEVSSDVTIEECWTWGFGARYGILLHGGLRNVARRNVTRYDGSVNGNPKAALALYSEDQSLAENNVTVDFDAATDSTNDVHAAFFTTSSVTLKPPASPPGLPAGLKTVSWYGNVAVNTVYATEAVMYFDSLASVGGTITAVDNVLGNGGAPFVAKDDGFGLWISNDEGTPHTAITARHNTIYGVKGKGVRVDGPPAWGSVVFEDNLISNLAASTSSCFDDASGSGTRIKAASNQIFQCDTSMRVPNDAALSTANPQLSYLLRIEAGTPGKGTGTAGSDRGANAFKRYVGGVLTAVDLWPFPNEDSIKSDLCRGPDGAGISTRGHNATGWCASGKSLTKYVWEQLGNASPY